MNGIFDHLTLQVTDVDKSRAWYERLLAPLGIRPEHEDGKAVGFVGSQPGSFWLAPAESNEARELHVAFRAQSREAVRQFHAAALSLGAEILYPPQVFPRYHPTYYAAFARDPDGHSIEAVCHGAE